MLLHRATARRDARSEPAARRPAGAVSRAAGPSSSRHEVGSNDAVIPQRGGTHTAASHGVARLSQLLRRSGRVTEVAHIARRLQARSSVPAPGGTVQRYKAVPASNAYTVARDMSSGAREPFTLVSEQIGALPRPSAKAGLGMGYAATNPSHPRLLVADDESLAVNAQQGEPKEFYAGGAVVGSANAALADVGSPVHLVSIGNKVTLTSGQELVMVQPALRDAEPPEAGRFAVLANTICRDTAKEILGGGLTHARIGSGTSETVAPIDTTGGQVVGGTHELAGALAAGAVTVAEARKMLAEGRSELVKKAPMTGGKNYGLAAASIGPRAQTLGVNEFARARVGEGYVTQSIGTEQGTDVDFTSGAAQQRQFIWGYHYSSVVAESTDRRDQIAMENYARTRDWIDGRAALLAALKTQFASRISGLALAGKDHLQIGHILHYLETGIRATVQEASDAYGQMFTERLKDTGAMWYFRMVGSAAGESFHEQQARSGYFANPLTMAVTNLALPSENTVMFADGSSTLDGQAQAALGRFARTLQTRVSRGAQVTRVKVVGYASGSGLGVTSGRLARARATSAAGFLVGQGLDQRLVSTAAGRAGTWSKDNPAANRRVTVTAEV